ncbi:MAG: branched-chain amino acid ABC transporter permease [Methanomicrobiales archaeon]|nr:branched-chain amino acid ABC transporter permease [Methanomicrobiales archaeon]
MRWPFQRSAGSILSIAVLLVGCLIPLFPFINRYILDVVMLMLIFILYASAWNFLTHSGQGSLGHAAFFGLGGYASSLFVLKTGMPVLPAIFIGGAFAAFIGSLIGLTCVRLKEWFLAMVTFGFAIIIQTITVSQLAPITGGWDGYAAPRLVATSVAGSHIYEYYIIFFLTIFFLIVIRYLLKSPIGLALSAIRENELEARASGVNPVRFKLLAFIISAYIAGIAGALEIHHFGYITPEIFGLDLSFWPIIYSITGGLGRLGGPIVGTIVVTVLWDGLNAIGFTYERFIVIGVMLVVIIIFLPKGLISFLDRIGDMEKRH